MKSKTFRRWMFLLHRYLALAVGFVIVLVGFTGSLLVFQPEFQQWSLQQKIGTVIPQSQRLCTLTESYGEFPKLQNEMYLLVNEPQSFVNEPQSFVNEPQSFVNEPQSFTNEPQSFTNEPQSSVKRLPIKKISNQGTHSRY